MRMVQSGCANVKEPGPAIPRTQEVGVWWGGYSPWTMMPSLLVCVVLTGAIMWWAWTYLERGYVQLAVLGLTGAVWVIQTVRFGLRFLGINYHVTTRRLVQDWGIIRKTIRTLFLHDVERIEVKRTGLEKFLGVGRVFFFPRLPDQPPMIWKGVRQCNQVAERVRAVLLMDEKQ